jgi:2-dehydro-3-deoxyphosphooctonate aldolase (KDO 8-P synthase)
MSNTVTAANFNIGDPQSLTLVAGPCVIEDYQITYTIADRLKTLCGNVGLPLIFKASYDKANRTSITSFRGPGAADGLAILAKIKRELDIPILSDVHRVAEVDAAAEVLDIIQIPAFLCRQTDLILAVAKTGKPINIKKGQFLAPWDMPNIIAKAESAGNRQVVITERGAMFGYNNLVVDFRGIQIMQQAGCPVIFDATHSVQLPGGAGKSSGGQREFAPLLARAAVAAGVDGVFIEVHPNPEEALCDGPNSLPLDMLEPFLRQLKAIKQAVST